MANDLRGTPNDFVARARTELIATLGSTDRETKKVNAWRVNANYGVVLQVDQSQREQAAFLWVPYPPEGAVLPEVALQYPAEQGRHSNTYASPGLGKGEPALKLVLRTENELRDAISYIRAAAASRPLPSVQRETVSPATPIPVDVSTMPQAEPVAPRRTAIPKPVQREVWQRDGGRCVECNTREKLCFDHIVPFSKGGSNSVRNLQLLCESCNSSKGNRT